MTAKSISLIVGATLAVAALIAYFNLTIFVIQPIGAVPEGRTLVTARVGKARFIESADAICERELGGVSLLCRSITMGRFLDETEIFFRLPYSETLYLWSTGGREYSR